MESRIQSLRILALLIPLVFAVGQCYKTDFLGTLPSKAISSNGYKYKNGDKSGSPITLRLDKEIELRLRSEADSQDTSINAITNKALRRYVEWNAFEHKSGMIPVSAPVLIELLHRISDEEIVNIAKTAGKDAARDITLLTKGKIDADSFISWFLARMKNCSAIEEIKDSRMISNGNDIRHSSRTYVLKHQLGYKWSLFHKTVLESIFHEILTTPIETKITDCILMFRIKEEEITIT